MGRSSISNYNQQINILNAEYSRFSDTANVALSKLGNVTNINASREYLLQNVSKYDVMFIALQNTIDRLILDEAKRMKCIVTPTTGINHIDNKYAIELGIDIISLKGEVAFLQEISATAELTWGLLLSLLRDIPNSTQDVIKKCNWQRNNFYGNELKNKTLGVIGYGRLGKMVARYGKAFNMSVIAYDRNKISKDKFVKFMSLEDLVSKSDVITVHLSLNDETKNIINENIFNQMKDGAILINTARGEIIDEEAFLFALNSKRISAAIDVLADEISLDNNWLIKNKLVQYAKKNDNLIITPHIGGVTYESVEQANLFMIKKLEKYLSN